LYDNANVEQYFFVDADNQQHIKRMAMVQFEGYLPNINATYDYPATKTVNLGGQTYIVNAESIPNVSAMLKQIHNQTPLAPRRFWTAKAFALVSQLCFSVLCGW